MKAIRRSERAQLLLLLSPFLAGALLLVVLPAGVTLVLSLFDYDLLGAPSFAFLDNFSDLAADPVFRQALVNSLVFVALAVPLRLLGAVALALLLHRNFRGAGAHRTAAYLPTVVPDIAYALIWLFIFNPVYGPLGAGLGALGLPEPNWLTSPVGAMAAVVVMSAFTIGEGFIVALAARQELSEELYDIARLEGSRPLATFRRVTLPLMAPTLALLTFRDIALSLQASFVPALIVTGGGPDRATLFLPLLIYDTAFEDLRYGYAAAMTFTAFVITGLMVYLQYRVLRRWRFGFGT